MAERIGILVVNQISASGLSRLPPEIYEVGNDVADPVAILVRSADLHKAAIPASVRAIGRAGAGTFTRRASGRSSGFPTRAQPR
jgi:D-3-phosphoglycerate dehydrogenase